MIVIKHAPAGYIASLHSDRDPPGWTKPYPYPGNYLNAMGKWCPTAEEAVETLHKDIGHRIKLAQAAVERKQAVLSALLDANKVTIRDDI